MSTTIFHITKKKDWQDAKQLGFYQSERFDQEGFIHCSTPTQFLSVLKAHYQDVNGLVLLEIEQEALLAPVVYEGTGAMFPHIYGKLNIGAVRAAYPLTAMEFPVPLALVQDILVRKARETDVLEFAGISEDEIFSHKVFVAEKQGYILAAAIKVGSEVRVVLQDHHNKDLDLALRQGLDS